MLTCDVVGYTLPVPTWEVTQHEQKPLRPHLKVIQGHSSSLASYRFQALCFVHQETVAMARNGRTLFFATLGCAMLRMLCAQASDRLTEHKLQLPAPLQSSEGKGPPERVSGYFRLNRE